MKYILRPTNLAAIVLLFSACENIDVSPSTDAPKNDAFHSYWYQSKAEISTYKLEQARYGEIRQGTTTMIFVTEPFSKKKQVKADNAMSDQVINVLKLNQTRKFNTGIYPYSTMTSTFTPVDFSYPASSLKVTNTVQEWCGQVFLQMNKRNNKYQVNSFSYFESEGDQQTNLPTTLLEDEIFNLIRINPKGLPTGNTKVIPSSLYLRLSHKPLSVYEANCQFAIVEFEGKECQSYSVNFPDLDRVYTIYYDNQFPYEIHGWTDEYKGIMGARLTSKATKVNQKLIDYWNKNKLKDSILYKELFDFKLQP